MRILASIRKTGLLIGMMFSPVAAFAAPILLEGVVANIDDKPILVSEFRARQQQTMRLLQQQKVSLDSVPDLKQRILNDMINEALESNLAKTQNIQISDLELNRQIELIALQNQLSVIEFQKVVATQGDWGDYLMTVRKQMLLQRVKQNVLRGRIQIDESEVDDFLKRKARSSAGFEYEVSQILIPTDNDASTDEAAQSVSQSVYDQIQSGMTFSEASAKYSADKNALSGGNLGWLNVNNLPDEFLDALLTLKTGSITQPIESPLGYHILLLKQKRGQKQQRLKRYQFQQIFLSALNYSRGEANLKLTRLKLELRDSLNEMGKIVNRHSDAEPLNEYKPWWVQGRFDPRLEQAVKSLALSEISEVIETNQGWHLVVLTKAESFDATELLQKEQARSFLIEQQAQHEYASYLQKLRDRTAISINQSLLQQI